MRDETPVCPCCGTHNIRMAGKHGWIECDDCGEEGHAVQYGDWLTGQEGPHMIPNGYAEQ